ncbi:threonine aldolase family protein [Alkalitalea saponilacus]|uniref:L-threonine aldolase n=1 Tax=Alkalitalea saponilacus TaxID=889453 RepID=A0A1T5DEP4_9BACT|nr:low specificity L-threonine aldolase [Alkalitalea saponilacus]ASB50677.1 threonine aldolase [Alkalitalea saponilacus]SKB69993.1 L-threonine aldolase [Alkalitalea saponilacus]
MNKRGFASDNNAGVHPLIMQALNDVNNGHTVGYGGDVYTQDCLNLFKKEFGEETETFFVYNGTGANIIALQAMARPYEAVICAHTAHINVDECGAPEKQTGCKLIDIWSPDGKLTPELIEPYLTGGGVEHHVQPKVISITQSTEMGTLYSLLELKALCSWAHDRGLLVHMDGARLSNAAAALNCSMAETSANAGVDVLSLGGTKNGMMFGEAVVVFNKDLSNGLKFIRKQSAQLHSKMRFISAQFNAFFTNELWRLNALHANKMAQKLAKEASKVPGVSITQKVEANGVFAIIPKQWIETLKEQYFFYTWDENRSEVRWMTAFDTTDEDIEGFTKLLREIAKKDTN